MPKKDLISFFVYFFVTTGFSLRSYFYFYTLTQASNNWMIIDHLFIYLV